MNKAKIFCLLIALVMVLTAFTACSGGSDSTKPASKPSSTTPGQTGTEPVTSAPAYEAPNMVIDRDFLILGIEHYDYGHIDLFADELNDEAINDAVYERNSEIFELFGTTITGDLSKSVYKDASSNIGSGIDAYDVYMPPMSDAVKLAKDEYLIDLNEIENLHLENPWWDQGAIESMTINGKTFFATGEITILDEELCLAMIFNKTKLNELKPDLDVYQMVRDNTWTFENFSTILKDVTYELVDDGVKDENDQWGLLAFSNSATFFYLGTGESMVKKNESGYPEIAMYGTRATNALQTILGLMLDDSRVLLSNKVSDGQVEIDMIVDGRALFRYTTLRQIRNMREATNVIGILPQPKLDADQDYYYTATSSNGYVPGVCVPVTNSAPAEAGAILEAMAYYASVHITPAFKETTLEGIVLKDLDSIEMLNILFAHKVFDIGYTYNFGDMCFFLSNECVLKGSADYVSALDKISGDITSDIEDLYNQFV